MKRIVWIMLVVAMVALAACGGKAETIQDSPLAPGIANPASQHCEKEGHTLEIRTAADGSQTGYCIFADGTECEEWAYYHGECKPGTPKP